MEMVRRSAVSRYRYSGNRTMWQKIWTRENKAALLLCIVINLLLIVTTSDAPTWIYQGF
jgi:hypothetical protein